MRFVFLLISLCFSGSCLAQMTLNKIIDQSVMSAKFEVVDKYYDNRPMTYAGIARDGREIVSRVNQLLTFYELEVTDPYFGARIGQSITVYVDGGRATDDEGQSYRIVNSAEYEADIGDVFIMFVDYDELNNLYKSLGQSYTVFDIEIVDGQEVYRSRTGRPVFIELPSRNGGSVVSEKKVFTFGDFMGALEK